MANRFAFIAVLSLILASHSSILAQGTIAGVLSTTQHPALGTILTDANGATVYSWAGDNQGGGTSACNGPCANAWPPVTVDANTAAGMMEITTGVGAIVRDDGAYQLMFDGWPLYRFVNDRAPGDANGNGSTGFGALWSVINVAPPTEVM